MSTSLKSFGLLWKMIQSSIKCTVCSQTVYENWRYAPPRPPPCHLSAAARNNWHGSKPSVARFTDQLNLFSVLLYTVHRSFLYSARPSVSFPPHLSLLLSHSVHLSHHMSYICLLHSALIPLISSGLLQFPTLLNLYHPVDSFYLLFITFA